MEQQIQNETEINEIQHKCPGCGSNMKFDIETGNLMCMHCKTSKEFNNTEAVERRMMCADIMKTHKTWTDGTVFRCSNCGAKEVISKKDISKKCAFCGSGAVVSSKDLPGIQPDSVIPFRITSQTANDNFRKWKKKRWFAPNSFKKQDTVADLNAFYTPCWSFSSNTQSMYAGQLGRTHTVHTRNGTRTTVRWFRVNGVMNQPYMDHFIQSGDRVSNATFNRLKPFNLQQVQVYRTEFLAGIVAEHYSRNLETCFGQFSQFVKSDLRRRVMRRYNADHCSFLDVQTVYNDKRFNYILLPLYINNYKYKKKNYNFFVNGQSGKIIGQYPKSKAKIGALITGIIGIIAAAAIIIVLGGF